MWPRRQRFHAYLELIILPLRSSLLFPPPLRSPPLSSPPLPSTLLIFFSRKDIGLCINCNVQPAVFGFVHSKDDVAHSAFCLSCSPLYRRSTCVCCAEVCCVLGSVALRCEVLRCVALSCVALRVSVTLYFMSICLLIIQVSSTFYFSPTAPTCCAWTCIAVAPCVTCDEDGVALPKTASVWRLRRSEETQVTHRTVTLDVRYCRDHFPVDPHSDISFVFLFFFFFFFSSSLLFSPLYFLLFAYVFRYGRFFATGYM